MLFVARVVIGIPPIVISPLKSLLFDERLPDRKEIRIVDCEDPNWMEQPDKFSRRGIPPGHIRALVPVAV
jgi:hypothetical protein